MPTKDTSIQLLSEHTEKIILEQTPSKFVKTRPGPSGKPLSYVEVGYVIDTLNKAFGYDWDFVIKDKTIGKKQIVVTGQLTVHFYHAPSNTWRAVTKEQAGGIDIKFNRTTGEMVSIADDEKAAASDALKKCASMFGIARDIFWPSGEIESEPEHGRLVTPNLLKQEADGYIHEPTEQAFPDYTAETKITPATPKQKSFIKKLYTEGKIPLDNDQDIESYIAHIDIAQASSIIAQATGGK